MALMLALALLAPDPVSLSLHDAVTLALRENFDLRIARLQRIADRFTIPVAEERLTPRLSAQLSAGNVASRGLPSVQRVGGAVLTANPHAEWLLPTGTLLAVDLQTQAAAPPSISGQSWQSMNDKPFGAALAVSVSQPLVRRFGMAVNVAPVEVARLQEGINRLTLKTQLLGGVAEVILSYRAFAGTQLVLDSARKAVGRARDLMDINYQMVGAGRLARADLIQVESDVATREVNALNVEADSIAAQIALLRLLGLRDDTPIIPVQETVREIDVPELDSAYELALQHRPDVASSHLAQRIAAKNLLIAEDNRLWDVRLMAQWVRGGVGFVGGQTLLTPITGSAESAFLGLTLSVPLVDITLRQQVLNSQVALFQAEVGVQAARRQVRLDVEEALRVLTLKSNLLILARKARELAERKLDNEREKLAAGRSSNFVVLRFVDDVVGAEIAEINARIDYENSVTALQARQGTLLTPYQPVID